MTNYKDMVGQLTDQPEYLEQLYQQARKAKETDQFEAAIEVNHKDHPENALFAAWYYRFQYAAGQGKEAFINWSWVIPLALANGLIFWWLSDDNRFMIDVVYRTDFNREFIPTLVLLAGPITVAFILSYLTVSGRKDWGPSITIAFVPILTAIYSIWFAPEIGIVAFQEQYLTLMAMHLPLLSWSAVGVYLMLEFQDPDTRFAFLIKSLEVFIMGGLFLIAGGLFVGITVGLFDVLGINFPTIVERMIFAGGLGLIPIVATAVIYNPTMPAHEQSFEEGLSKIIATLMRILLPLSLLVLVIYLAFIPFNFWEPFDNRDVLIIYNGLLFAVTALLVGATPVKATDLAPAVAIWLRRAIMAVAVLTLIISVYALSAILYRTAEGELTPNRLTFIGWNCVNISLLVMIIWFQLRSGQDNWLQGLYKAYAAGTVAYAGWTLIVILILPWTFGIDENQVSTLPERVQELIYTSPPPLVVKCSSSPHVFVIEGAEKRWIKDIQTFENQGLEWRDVDFISCDDLRAIPYGEPIPRNAGPPPDVRVPITNIV